MATSEPPPPPPPPPPSTTPQRWKRELRVMLRIALPIVATNLLGVTMTLVDFAMVGRLGKEELGGAALGNTVFYLLHFPMLGLLTALDTLLAAAFGAGNFEAYGAWTQTASAVVSALSIPVSVFLGVATTPLLLAIGQDATLSKLAGRYCAHLTWGLLPYYLFIVAMKFMQTQRVLAPPVWIAVIANVVNVGLNYALIYAADLGFDGAPIATSASRWFQFIAGMTYLLSRPASTAKTRPRSFIGWRRLRRSVVAFASLAGPGLAMLMIEAWTFEITTIMAGYLGTVALDAHLTMLQLATFSFLSLPFAVAAAATIRIGAALGGGDAAAAKDAAAITFAVSLGFMAICGVIFAACADYLGYLFTDDEEVVRAVAEIAYIAALFQLADGGQGAAGGVFRGMGKQLTVMKRNLLGFWVLGLPAGGLLCFVAGMRLPGLWWGLTVGLSVTTAISVAHLSMIDWELERDLAIERGLKNGSRDGDGDADGGDDANDDDVVAEAAYVRGERENGGKYDNVV